MINRLLLPIAALAMLLTMPACVHMGTPEALTLMPELLTRPVVCFSDKEEFPKSKTEIAFGQREGRLSYDVVGDGEHGAYAGMVLPLGKRNLLPFTGVEVRATVAGGSLAFVQLESSGGIRQNVATGPYTHRNGDDVVVRIPFAAYDQLGMADRKSVRKLAFLVQGKGQLTFTDVALTFEPIAAAKSRYPKPPKQAFKRGHGLWLYAADEGIKSRIQAFNEKAKLPIRYLFIYTGSVGGNDFSYNTERLAFYADIPDIELYANLDGLSEDLHGSSEAEIITLARAIAARIDGDNMVAGVHVDIEPYTPECLSLYAALQTAMRKPLSVALGRWDPDVMTLSDMPVLMGYDYAKDPGKFERVAKGRYGAFANSAKATDSAFMIGVPAIATHNEYAYRVHIESGKREAGGGEAVDYLDRALKIVAALPPDDQMLGIAIWATLTRPVGGRDGYHYHPYTPPPAAWEMLEAFDAH